MSFVKHHIEKAVLFKEAHAPFQLLIVNNQQIVVKNVLKHRSSAGLVNHNCLNALEKFIDFLKPVVSQTSRTHHQVHTLALLLCTFIEHYN